MKNKITAHLKLLILSTFFSYSVFIFGAEKEGEQNHSYALRTQQNSYLFLFNKKTALYQCRTCGVEMGRKAHMESHLSIHTDECPYECDYENDTGVSCKKKFKRVDLLKRHETEVHLKVKSYGCTLCEKRFKRAAHAAGHLKAVHCIIAQELEILTKPSSDIQEQRDKKNRTKRKFTNLEALATVEQATSILKTLVDTLLENEVQEASLSIPTPVIETSEALPSLLFGQPAEPHYLPLSDLEEMMLGRKRNF